MDWDWMTRLRAMRPRQAVLITVVQILNEQMQFISDMYPNFASRVSDEEEGDETLTSEQQLQYALSRLPQILPPTNNTPSALEKRENETVENLILHGCGCHKN